MAWPESLIALTNEHAEYAKEQGEADEEDGPWETIVEAPNGSYFTVSDLVHAIADLEDEEDGKDHEDATTNQHDAKHEDARARATVYKGLDQDAGIHAVKGLFQLQPLNTMLVISGALLGVR